MRECICADSTSTPLSISGIPPTHLSLFICSCYYPSRPRLETSSPAIFPLVIQFFIYDSHPDETFIRRIYHWLSRSLTFSLPAPGNERFPLSYNFRFLPKLPGPLGASPTLNLVSIRTPRPASTQHGRRTPVSTCPYAHARGAVSLAHRARLMNMGRPGAGLYAWVCISLVHRPPRRKREDTFGDSSALALLMPLSAHWHVKECTVYRCASQILCARKRAPMG